MKIIDSLNRKLDKLVKEPNNCEYYNDVGVILYQLKDFENCELYLKRAHQLAKTNREILYNYAIVLEKQFKLEKAAKMYESYLKLGRDDNHIAQKLEEIKYRLKDYATAMNDEEGDPIK